MYSTNIADARINLNSLVDMAIEESEIVNINTKKGNAVLISENVYNALRETLYLLSKTKTKDEIIEGMNTPLVECEELDWNNIE